MDKRRIFLRLSAGSLNTGLPQRPACGLPDSAFANTKALRRRCRGQGLEFVLLPWRPWSVAVLLDPRRAQAGKAMAVDRVLPVEEFLNRQRVPLARFFQ